MSNHSLSERPDPCLLLAGDMKEEGEGGLRETVEAVASVLGWRFRHNRDSRRQNVEGLPDLLMWNRGQQRLIWVELKRQKGIVSEGQEMVIADLRACGQEVYLWRPSDHLDGTILRVLKGEKL